MSAVLAPSDFSSPLTMLIILALATILNAYYPGMESGSTLANILFGKVNPSGKLSVSYPKRLEDNHSFLNFGFGQTTFYGGGFVGYRYYVNPYAARLDLQEQRTL